MRTTADTAAVLVLMLGLLLAAGCDGGGGGGGGDGDDDPKPPDKVTITTRCSHPNLTYTVDGADYTGERTFQWTPGSHHTLGAPSPQIEGDTYVWSAWSDGGARTHTITTPSSATTYTATFVLQGSVAVNDYVMDSGGGEAEVNPYVTDHFGVHACIGQGAAHIAGGSKATNGTTDCEGGFAGAVLAVEVNPPVAGSTAGAPPEIF
ncbi:MAG TPA: hypothetical protein PK280_10600 [Planctomycetota bacterium]|nr:hypothetical protein [Planctomycetota bacterium]